MQENRYRMKYQLTYIIAIILTFLLFSCLSQATELKNNKGLLQEIKFGLLKHDVDGLWSGKKRESGVDINIEGVFSAFLPLFSGEIHSAAGASVNTQGDTSQIYVDVIWQYDFNKHYFARPSMGFALHNGKNSNTDSDRKALGTRLLMHFSIEMGYRFSPQWASSIYFDHISNSGTTDLNQGLDTLGLRIGYLF